MLYLRPDNNPLTKILNHPNASYDYEESTSRSSYQLYRYHHEPVTSNLLPRDIPPIFICLFFLFLIIIILSQILIVHSSRSGANMSNMYKIQEELKQMDESMETILREDVLPIDKWRLLFHIQNYVYRFKDLFNQQNHSASDEMRNESLHNRTQRNYCHEEPDQLRMLKC